MINKSILSSALTNKFSLLALHSIVNECFINGLPMNQSEISDDEKIALTKYSYKVLNKVGGFKALENSLASNTYNAKQKALLTDIHKLCKESAMEACKRIVTETDCKDPSKKFDDVVDQAAFTDEEYKRFAEKADKMDLGAISEIIKDKTLKVLKDEQEQYEKEEQLESELKDALAESKDFANATTESYMDIVLTKSEPRHHVTLFSKLQEAAFEMTYITPVLNGTDVMPIIDKVTFESFLEPLRINNVDIDKCYESYVENADDKLANVSDEMKPQISSLVSIVIYTVMETLKTLNIYCPSQDVIKKFVCATANGEKVKATKAYDVYTKAEEMLKEANCTDFTKINSAKLSTILVELKKISDILESFIANGIDGVESSKVTTTLDGLHAQMERIENVLNEKMITEKAKAEESAKSTYYGDLQKSNDIAQFNKISNLFSRNPLVSEIRLKVNPNNIGSIIDVDAANEAGQVIKSSFMNMQVAVESSKYFEYLDNAFKQSKLADVEKRICIIVNDGTGKKITLN
jgi:hypothetical protein